MGRRREKEWEGEREGRRNLGLISSPLGFILKIMEIMKPGSSKNEREWKRLSCSSPSPADFSSLIGNVTWPSQPQNWGEPGSHLGLSLQSRWSVCPGYTPNVAALRAPAGSAVGVQTVPAPGQEWLSGSWFTPRSIFSEFNEQSSEGWRGGPRFESWLQKLYATNVFFLLGFSMSFRKLQRKVTS